MNSYITPSPKHILCWIVTVFLSVATLSAQAGHAPCFQLIDLYILALENRAAKLAGYANRDDVPVEDLALVLQQYRDSIEQFGGLYVESDKVNIQSLSDSIRNNFRQRLKDDWSSDDTPFTTLHFQLDDIVSKLASHLHARLATGDALKKLSQLAKKYQQAQDPGAGPEPLNKAATTDLYLEYETLVNELFPDLYIQSMHRSHQLLPALNDFLMRSTNEFQVVIVPQEYLSARSHAPQPPARTFTISGWMLTHTVSRGEEKKLTLLSKLDVKPTDEAAAYIDEVVTIKGSSLVEKGRRLPLHKVPLQHTDPDTDKNRYVQTINEQQINSFSMPGGRFGITLTFTKSTRSL
ncbi:hypothetical protein [Parendozoicomonas haliclonae]|uniref:Gliding motility-associated protein GldM N-terminal domain-containing protein n=1 Tax=Parendozoicomonas haliclonae TaxID=1960125 RepID=A0A1X7AKD4_9GAMM|nr:hypothetical protein [Parendozoicomonas haliclonae]SMA43583.1 hypothetical protein EHSB41UT_01628 [Parendozoicomonas haliclonae]